MLKSLGFSLLAAHMFAADPAMFRGDPSHSGVYGVVFFGCRDGHFYAVDAKTGGEKWNLDNPISTP